MASLVVIDQIDEEVTTLLNRISDSYTNESTDELIIVNLTDHPVDTQDWMVGANIALISGFDIYASIESEFSHFLEEWLSNLLIEQPAFPFIQYSRLSEQNFSHGLFQDLKQLHLIDHLLQQNVLEQVIFIGNREISVCVERLCAHHSVAVIVDRHRVHKLFRYRRIRSIATTFLLFFFNLLTEICTLLFVCLFDCITDRARPRCNGVGIYAIYPSSWDFNEIQPRYRYTNDLYKTIDPPEDAYYLISLLRRNTDVLNGLSLSLKACRRLFGFQQRFTVLEGHGSLKDILAAYVSLAKWLSWYRGWRALERSGRLDCFSISIAELLTPIKFAILREIPKNIYTELCARNFSATYSPRYLYIPLYELLEGRAVTCAARLENTIVIGIQHGVMFNLQRHRVITSLALIHENGFSSMVPDIIAVEGDYVKQMYSTYESIFNKIEVVGAPRIFWEQSKGASGENQNPSGRNSILVFGDRYAATKLNELAVSLSREYQIIFRCHPGAQDLEKIEGFVNSPGHELIVDTGHFSITELTEFYRPTAGIICMSGISVELAMLGVPVILIKSNLYPIISPLVGGECKIPLLGSQKDITEELRLLIVSPDYRKRRAIDGKRLSRDIVEYTGRTATNELGRLINKSPS